MRYSPDPPYEILSTNVMDFATMQRLQRFARYWDLVANSGRFSRTLSLLLNIKSDELDTQKISAFRSFIAFADWLYAHTGKTHQIALERLFDLIHTWLLEQGLPREAIDLAIEADYQASGAKGRLTTMPRGVSIGDKNLSNKKTAASVLAQSGAAPLRQARHMI